MIKIIANGNVFHDFVQATCTRTLDTLANDFSFTASSIKRVPPFSLGDSIQIEVDGKIQLSGIIESEDGSESEGGHEITYSGRDLTADMIDSSFYGYGDIDSNITLKELIKAALSNIGSKISVIDNVNPEPFNIAEDVIKPENGANCFDFCVGFAKKRQCMLTSDQDGNIVIELDKFTETNNILIRKKGVDGNILSQSWSKNRSSRFYRYVYLGQLSPLALNNSGEYKNKTVVENNGFSIDPDMHQSRQYVAVQDDSYSNSQLEKRATWEKFRRKARGSRFNCEVKGHTDQEGNVWRENSLCLIDSEPAGISDYMVLNTVSFVYAEGAQTVTHLSFVDRGIYDFK